jgi:hypothetical protein
MPGSFNVAIKLFEELIAKGGDYAEKFRGRLLVGMMPFRRYCKPNPDGAPALQMKRSGSDVWTVV